MKKGTPNAADVYPIGTGPFEFVSYQKDATIRYKAFDKHWRAGRRSTSSSTRSRATPTARYAKLKTGECHVMAFPKPADLDEMQKDPQRSNVLQKEGLNIGYIAFNVEKKPFDNKLVRQALNLATNKDAILKAVYQGNGQVAKNPIPPILWSYNNACRTIRTIRRRRSSCSTQAGYPNGFEVDLWYLPVTRPYNPDGKRMAELIQADWEKIGVKAKLITYEWAEYRKRSKGGEQTVMMFGWSGDNGDPGQLLRPLLGCEAVKGGGNVARWCNKDVRGPGHQGRADAQAGRPRQALRAGAGDLQGRSAVDHRRALDPLRSAAQGSAGLQDGRDRASLFQQRRSGEATVVGKRHGADASPVRDATHRPHPKRSVTRVRGQSA